VLFAEARRAWQRYVGVSRFMRSDKISAHIMNVSMCESVAHVLSSSCWDRLPDLCEILGVEGVGAGDLEKQSWLTN
jgi:hypothetical protein